MGSAGVGASAFVLRGIIFPFKALLGLSTSCLEPQKELVEPLSILPTFLIRHARISRAFLPGKAFFR